MQRLIDRRARVVFGMQDHDRRADVCYVGQRRKLRIVGAGRIPRRTPVVVAAAQAVFAGEVGGKILALQVAHHALGHGCLIAVGVADDPQRCISAVRSAQDGHARGVDVGTLHGGVHHRLHVLEHRVAVVAFQRSLERITVSGASRRVGEDDVVALRRVDLKLVEERIAELRLGAAVNVEQRRMLRCRTASRRRHEPRLHRVSRWVGDRKLLRLRERHRCQVRSVDVRKLARRAAADLRDVDVGRVREVAVKIRNASAVVRDRARPGLAARRRYVGQRAAAKVERAQVRVTRAVDVEQRLRTVGQRGAAESAAFFHVGQQRVAPRNAVGGDENAAIGAVGLRRRNAG